MLSCPGRDAGMYNEFVRACSDTLKPINKPLLCTCTHTSTTGVRQAVQVIKHTSVTASLARRYVWTFTEPFQNSCSCLSSVSSAMQALTLSSAMFLKRTLSICYCAYVHAYCRHEQCFQLCCYIAQWYDTSLYASELMCCAAWRKLCYHNLCLRCMSTTIENRALNLC
jgi:hypothetical protein